MKIFCLYLWLGRTSILIVHLFFWSWQPLCVIFPLRRDLSFFLETMITGCAKFEIEGNIIPVLSTSVNFCLNLVWCSFGTVYGFWWRGLMSVSGLRIICLRFVLTMPVTCFDKTVNVAVKVSVGHLLSGFKFWHHLISYFYDSLFLQVM